MSDAAKVVIDNGSVFAGKENLEFYCKQLRGRLGDNPAECEHLWLVKLKLANPRLMVPEGLLSVEELPTRHDRHSRGGCP